MHSQDFHATKKFAIFKLPEVKLKDQQEDEIIKESGECYPKRYKSREEFMHALRMSTTMTEEELHFFNATLSITRDDIRNIQSLLRRVDELEVDKKSAFSEALDDRENTIDSTCHVRFLGTSVDSSSQLRPNTVSSTMRSRALHSASMHLKRLPLTSRPSTTSGTYRGRSLGTSALPAPPALSFDTGPAHTALSRANAAAPNEQTSLNKSSLDRTQTHKQVYGNVLRRTGTAPSGTTSSSSSRGRREAPTNTRTNSSSNLGSRQPSNNREIETVDASVAISRLGALLGATTLRSQTAPGGSRERLLSTAASAAVLHATKNLSHNNRSSEIPKRSKPVSPVPISSPYSELWSFSGSETSPLRGTQQREKPHVKPSNLLTSQALKQELVDSLRNMNKYSDLVKRQIIAMKLDGTIASTQHIPKPGLPIDNVHSPAHIRRVQSAVRASRFMSGLGADKLFRALEILAKRAQQVGWAAWLHVVRDMRTKEKKQQYIRVQGLRHLILIFNVHVVRFIRKKFANWKQYSDEISQSTVFKRRTAAAVTLQRVVRGNIVRAHVAIMRETRKYQRIYDATVKVQAFLRGRYHRIRFLATRKAYRERHAVLLLQRVIRGHLGRLEAVRRLLAFLRYRAAVRMQAFIRRIQAKMYADKLRLDSRIFFAARTLQAWLRGSLVRLERRREERVKVLHVAAIKIQTRARGMIDRLLYSARKKNMKRHKELLHYAATTIQRIYRGYRGYVISRMMLLERKQKTRVQYAAATKINTMTRGFLSRELRKKLEKSRHLSWIVASSMWQEMWSDENNAYFYTNATTGEAEWEPPLGGYTKVNGELVLETGAVIEDPRYKVDASFGLTVETKERKPLCSECSTRFAIFSCHECQDSFCSKCQKVLHSVGSRRLHSSTRTGLIDCSECEDLLAIRWCVSCDEGFCDVCWRKLHTHGNRRFHAYSEISSDGVVSKRVFTIDGQVAEAYDSAYSYVRQQREVASLSITEAAISNEWAESIQYGADADPDPVAEWAEYYDDNGYKYFYNNMTGVSQYESPV